MEPLDYGDPSLVGYWTFDEGTGSTTYDWSGNNATGSWNGTATGTSGYYSPGRIGSWAGAFDGSTDVITANVNGLPTGAAPRTFIAWVNVSQLANYRSAVFWGLQVTGEMTALEANVNSVFFSGLAADCSSAAILATSTWTQLVGVYTGTTSMIYANGMFLNSCPETFNTVSSTLQIGQRGGNHMYGLIDDVRIYNRALSATEIAALYAGGK
jgi:hypothetical protein